MTTDTTAHTSSAGKAEPGGSLHRGMNLRDLVFLNIACIVSLSSLAQVAQFGFASMPLWVVAILVFLIPSGIAVSELNARIPEEGGFYRWTRDAFGDWHGYLAAWTYWLSNIVWLPTVMVMLAKSLPYMLGEPWVHLGSSPWFVATVGISALWFSTVLNLLGIERAKWIQNIGAMATWASVLLLLVASGVYVAQIGSAHPFSPSALVPDFTDFGVLPFFAILAFSFGGLELGPVMAGEIRDPQRNVPRALFWSSIAVAIIYMTGTLALIVTIPEGEVGIVDGIAQAFHVIALATGMPIVGSIGALVVTVAAFGLFGAWMTGTARIPFVIGLEHYLPEKLAHIHPRWGSPHVSILMQAIVLTILLLASIAGSTVEEAFLILLDMSIILYFIPILYIFAVLPWHVRRGTGREGIFPWLVQRPWTVWVVGGAGFSITLLSTVLSAVPSREVSNPGLFVTKVVGGAVLLIGAGLIVYYVKRGEAVKRRAEEAREPRERQTAVRPLS